MKGEYFLFGLQRSGTNYLESLIKMNFETVKKNRSHKSWKHSIDIPKGIIAEKNTDLVIIHKNPYMWAESILFRNQVDWVKTQKTYDPLEEGPYMLGIGKNKLNLSSVIKTWVHFHESWLFNSMERKTFIVRYEDLLHDEFREDALRGMRDKFGWIKKSEYRAGVFRNPRPGTVSQSTDYDMGRHAYYREMKPQKLEPVHIEEINSLIDDKFFEIMNYRRIT